MKRIVHIFLATFLVLAQIAFVDNAYAEKLERTIRIQVNGINALDSRIPEKILRHVKKHLGTVMEIQPRHTIKEEDTPDEVDKVEMVDGVLRTKLRVLVDGIKVMDSHFPEEILKVVEKNLGKHITITPFYKRTAEDFVQEEMGKRAIKTFTGHKDSVSSVAFSKDGTHIVSGGHSEQTIKLWDLNRSKALRTFTDRGNVYSVSFNPNRAQVASGSKDCVVKIWRTDTNEVIECIGHQGPVSSVVYNNTGTLLASGSDDKTIKLWNSTTGVEVKTLEGSEKQVTSVVFTPDGRNIISGSTDGKIRVWDVKTGKASRTIDAHESMVLSIAFNSKGTQIASGSHDTSIKLWDLQTGTLLKTFHPVPPPYSVCFSSEGGVNSVAFSPDGSKLASASREETHSIMIWDIHTGSRVETLIGHTDWVNSVAFSPNGKQLISGSSDDTFKLWNMENDSGK